MGKPCRGQRHDDGSRRLRQRGQYGLGGTCGGVPIHRHVTGADLQDGRIGRAGSSHGARVSGFRARSGQPEGGRRHGRSGRSETTCWRPARKGARRWGLQRGPCGRGRRLGAAVAPAATAAAAALPRSCHGRRCFRRDVRFFASLPIASSIPAFTAAAAAAPSAAALACGGRQRRTGGRGCLERSWLCLRRRDRRQELDRFFRIRPRAHSRFRRGDGHRGFCRETARVGEWGRSGRRGAERRGGWWVEGGRGGEGGRCRA